MNGETLQNDFSGSRIVFYGDGKVSRSLADFIDTHKHIDRTSIVDFLLFGSMLPPRSPLQGVAQLFPGERIENGVSTLEYKERTYTVTHKTTEEFVDAIDTFLEQYFREHAHVSTVLLSGGIDSAIILSYLPRGARAITWGGRGPETSDIIYAQITGKHYDVKEHVLVYADYEKDLALYTKTVEALKIPLLFNSSVPFIRMAEKAQKLGVSDWFVGQNADTVFMSYPAPVLTKHLSRFNTFLPFNPLAFSGARKKYLLETNSVVKLLAYFKSLGVFPGSWLKIPSGYFEEKEALFKSLKTSNLEQRIILFEELLTESRRNQICQNEIPALYGITAHCPYYEKEFIELALSIPPALRSKNRYSKVILKKLAEKRGVPSEVIYKKKTGLSYGLESFVLEKKHLPLWDQMQNDPFMQEIIDVGQIRAREENNYLTFLMLSALFQWSQLVARPHKLVLPKSHDH